MKKIIILLGLSCLTSISIVAQSLLIYQQSGKVSIVNYDTKIESEIYEDYRFTEKILLSNDTDEKFVGYHWDDDSLSIFLENEGKIRYLKFKLDSIKALIPGRIRLESTNETTILKPNNNPFVTWNFDNISLVSQSGNDLRCYIDSTLIWTKSCRIKNFSCVIVGGGIWNLQISQDGEKLLMTIDGDLKEVDIRTGEEHLITKKPISNYVYSQNGRYIKYVRNGEVNIYDKLTSQKNTYKSWSNAFWLYK